MTTTGSTSPPSRVEQAADATREQASQVAGTAKEQVSDVMQQAREQAQSTAHRVQDDVRTRANEEATKFAETLRQASQQMNAMADAGASTESGQPALASSLVREGAQATQRLAERLDQGGVDAVLADVRTWARRNPGGFLLGAAVAGFVVGRAARNLTGDGNGQRANSNGMIASYTHQETALMSPEAYPQTDIIATGYGAPE
jgi:hypothetical protein